METDPAGWLDGSVKVLDDFSHVRECLTELSKEGLCCGVRG